MRMKRYDHLIFKIWGLRYLFNEECYVIFGKLILFRQPSNEVEELVELTVNEYLLNVSSMGLIKYYSQYIKEYIRNRITLKMNHADSRNSISMTLQEEARALEKLPDPLPLPEDFYA